jgi:hypothetical protein
MKRVGRRALIFSLIIVPVVFIFVVRLVVDVLDIVSDKVEDFTEDIRSLLPEW